MYKVVTKRFLNEAKSICLFEIEAPLIARHAQAARKADVRLDGFELSPDGVLAEGSAPSPDARQAFLDALRGASFAFVAEDRASRAGRAAFSLKRPKPPAAK